MRFIPALICLTLPLQAQAFAVKTTSMGAPVRWSTPHVSFGLASSGDTARDRLLAEAARRSALSWSVLGEVVVDVVDAPAGSKVGWKNDGSDANVIGWAEGDWSHDDDMLALTFLHYSADSGVILDADILVNDESYAWVDATEDSADGGYDLANALTHEVGHALGLGHSDVVTATMYASSASMETAKRDLDADDEAGLREIYADLVDPDTVVRAPLATPYGCQSMPAETPWIALVAVLVAIALDPRRRSRQPLQLAPGRVRPSKLVVVLGASVAAAVVGSAQASPHQMSVEDIVARADAVADVQVLSQTVEAKDGLIVTVSELKVLRCRAGWCPRTLVLEQLGGEKDGVGLIAEGITPVKPGDTLAIAAKSRGARWRMVGRDRGVLLDLRRTDVVRTAALERALRVAR